MKNLNQILSTPTRELYVGVVEVDNLSIVGVLDDPVGVELNALRLAYPLEVLFKPPVSGVVTLGFVQPEFGLPDEIVLDAGAVSVYTGNSPFCMIYLGWLERYVKGQPYRYEAAIITRPAARKP
jgi:hypothetical protein